MTSLTPEHLQTFQTLQALADKGQLNSEQKVLFDILKQAMDRLVAFQRSLPNTLTKQPPKTVYKVALDPKIPKAQIPTRGSSGAAGFDLYSPELVYIDPGRSALINTGVIFEIPDGIYGRIADKSSVMKQDVRTSGVIDSDYRGTVRVLLFNHSRATFKVRSGDGIAQIIFTPIVSPQLEQVRGVEEMSSTKRGSGGFGSTETPVTRCSSCGSRNWGTMFCSDCGFKAHQ